MNILRTPLISVLMPVYNAAAYVPESIESILNQTMGDFEFIILNDGSHDDSHRIIAEYQAQDRRIVYKNSEQIRNLPESLNYGLSLARGKYIVRMDSDDISLPERFAKQVAFMVHNPEVGVCGTWLDIILNLQPTRQYPLDHDSIYARTLFACSMAHNSVIMRADTLRKHNLKYDPLFRHAEDYDLWSRALAVTRFANIPEALLLYRIHPQNTFHKHGHDQKATRTRIHYRLLMSLGITPSPDDLRLHDQIGKQRRPVALGYLERARSWLEKIEQANRETGVIDPAALKAELERRWQTISTKPISLPHLMPTPLKRVLKYIKGNLR